MNLAPISIEQDGPGFDLTDVAAGISIGMCDPVSDFELTCPHERYQRLI